MSGTVHKEAETKPGENDFKMETEALKKAQAALQKFNPRKRKTGETFDEKVNNFDSLYKALVDAWKALPQQKAQEILAFSDLFSSV